MSRRGIPPLCTLGLVLIMCLVYLISIAVQGRHSGTAADPFQLTPQTLQAMGALTTPLSHPQDAWRLLSTLFVHVDAWHLLTNAALLLLAGAGVPGLGFRGLEEARGHGSLLLHFLLGGLCGSLLSSLIYAAVPTLCPGASGAVLALLVGALALPRVPLPFRAGLLLCLLGLLLSGVAQHGDHAAHGGGLLGGVLLIPWRRRSGPGPGG